MGKELYVYKKRTADKHKGMHSLVGVFIKDEGEKQLDSTTMLHGFRLTFPPNTVKQYYCESKEKKEEWMAAIKQTIGYTSMFDFYEIKKTLGKGKFGLVKSAIHKKTGKSVAVKVLSKKKMNAEEMTLQQREIHVMKMCQHPHIIRLIDLFENEDFLYIVMEQCAGGDLFKWLEERSFKLTEALARKLCHQLATAIYYLHSYGIAHRDLKPENILMTNSSDDAELKVVDFGLSKIVGPNETSTQPFGTLCYAAPEVLSSRPYGKEVDLWSLGVITYLFLAGSLPFDADDDREIARLTIEEQADFDFEEWHKVSAHAKNVVKGLLQKSRSKRWSLKEVLDDPWFADDASIHKARKEASKSPDRSKF